MPPPPLIDPRRRRLALRAMRRGTREMDLILGPFAQGALGAMSAADLDLFEALLEESDHDLYAWISGRPGQPGTGPAALHPLLDQIAAEASARWTQSG